ncbi:MAG TPA: hypothetical protein VF976_11075 [Gemmatimonadales bacterium]
MDQERLLRRVWLVNGVLLLALLGTLGTWLVFNLGSNLLHRETRVETVADGAPTEHAPRAIRYDTPQTIWKSSARVVLVRYGEAFQRPSEGLGSAGYRSEHYTPYVNVIFLEPDGRPARLLLNRPALIRSVSFPRSRDDSLQAWISYEIAFEDTDGDGGLDEDDAVSLYVSDLHGVAFHPVLPPDWSVLAEEPLGDGRHILALAAQRGDGRSLERAPERAFLHDVQTGRTEPYASLDSLAALAGRILGR